MWISKRNAEGYSDPTAYEALSSIIHKEKHSAKVKADFPKVYICSPFAGDMEMNVKRALKYCRFALARARLPIAPHCYFPRFMDDGIPSERELAVAARSGCSAAISAKAWPRRLPKPGGMESRSDTTPTTARRFPAMVAAENEAQIKPRGMMPATRENLP